MLDPGPAPQSQPFTRETAVRGVLEAVATEERHLDQLRQEFPVLWQAVMALVGYELMRGPVPEQEPACHL